MAFLLMDTLAFQLGRVSLSIRFYHTLLSGGWAIESNSTTPVGTGPRDFQELSHCNDKTSTRIPWEWPYTPQPHCSHLMALISDLPLPWHVRPCTSTVSVPGYATGEILAFGRHPSALEPLLLPCPCWPVLVLRS